MADSSGGVKQQWRSLLSAMSSLGHEALHQRARLLDQTPEEEGITAILPGERAVNWRCDPIPLPLSSWCRRRPCRRSCRSRRPTC